MNIKSDGKFIISRGQGLSQGIVQELGLSAEQVKLIDKTTWNSIFAEIEKEKEVNPNLYTGGNNLDGKTSQNFVVQTGQSIEISLQNCWQNILNIINNALGTNFEIETKDEVNDNNSISNEKIISENKTISISDDDMRKITELKNEARKKMKEVTESQGGHHAEWPQEAKDEYNNATKPLFNFIEQLVGIPGVKDIFVTIRDSQGNSMTMKSIVVTSNGRKSLGWIF